jgi:hypothetical protein
MNRSGHGPQATEQIGRSFQFPDFLPLSLEHNPRRYYSFFDMSGNLPILIRLENFLLDGAATIPMGNKLPGVEADEAYYEAYKKYHAAAVSFHFFLYYYSI